MDASKTVATIHRLSRSITENVGFIRWDALGREGRGNGCLTHRATLDVQHDVIGHWPHSDMVTRRLARATSPPFCWNRQGEYKGSVATFCLYSRSKSSLRFGPQFGCLWNSSHASSFWSWNCFSSASFLQRSRSLRSSASLRPRRLPLQLACQTAVVFHGTFWRGWRNPGPLGEDCSWLSDVTDHKAPTLTCWFCHNDILENFACWLESC